MSRIWFSGDLETVATFWRVTRRDGVTLGFTTHDQDIWLDGVLHRATPGMVPSSIRRSADFEPDSAEVEGALSHDSISAADLAAGRFDGARIVIGLVDWENAQSDIIYRGAIGSVSEESGRFSADLQSRKAELNRDTIPRTSPSCRAQFCGPECGLSAPLHTTEVALLTHDTEENRVTFDLGGAGTAWICGSLRWLDGPQTGVSMAIIDGSGDALLLDTPIDGGLISGTRAELREGCDRRLETCASRFANAINFRGEPFLPGNDLIARYPSPNQ